MSTANTPTRIHVETVADSMLVWYELCETLAFLADVTGAKIDERGLRNIEDDMSIQWSSSGCNGEVYIRAAALERCYNLANEVSPEHIVYLHDRASADTQERDSHE